MSFWRIIVKSHLLAVTAAVFLSACSERECLSDAPTAATLMLPLAQQSPTRAHFTDEAGTARFVWDVDSKMIAAVADGQGLAQWTDGSYFSPMNIALLDPASSNKVLSAGSALTLHADAAGVGDNLYYLSPVSGSDLCQTSASADRLAVTFTLPHTFEQSATGRLDEFEPYCFIHGEATVLSVPAAGNKNFVSNTALFRAIPAIFRFNITNNTTADLTLESVKITCNKGFPDRLCWTCDAAEATIGELTDKSGYCSTIKTVINPGRGEEIAARQEETTSTATYYAMCLPFDSDDSMAGATLAFILETTDKTHTFNVSAEEFFRHAEAGHRRFESNKIYTFNFTMNERSVELEKVSVADWKEVPFYYPTEEVSTFITLHPSYWVQDRKNLHTYGFVPMCGEAPAATMWAECNLGEYLYYSIENQLPWTVVSPADEADADYLAPFFDGITDFKWQTPSREDFTRLLGVEANVEAVCDEGSGVYGLRIRSGVNPAASIFLPCSYTTKTDYMEEGTTNIHREFHGYYWTREAVDEDHAYLCHFAFKQVETVVDESSTFSPFTKVINSGNDIYEFLTAPKRDGHVVRAILKE